jgi:hypothetical protein
MMLNDDHTGFLDVDGDMIYLHNESTSRWWSKTLDLKNEKLYCKHLFRISMYTDIYVCCQNNL